MKRYLACVFAVVCGLSVLAMGLSDELTATGADKKGSSAETYSLFLHTDGDWRIKGDSAEVNLGTIADPVDHGSTTGKGDDDHTQYLNATRHGIGTTHVSGFNNTLPISGDANGNTTQGAHNADGDIHELPSAQSLRVAKDGTGQYAAIAAALAVANANANPTTPYEVVIYPGIYAEFNLAVGDFVSLRSVVPWQAKIAEDSLNPILIIEGDSTIDGVAIDNGATGPAVQFTSAASGDVYLEHIKITSFSGGALDFNATTQNVNIDSGSVISSAGGSLVFGKTAACRLVARNAEFSFTGANAVASIIDIDESNPTLATGPDLFDSCQFYAPNLTGGTTPASFIDWDADVLWLRNCQFTLGVNTAKTLSGILAQSGTVSVQGCKFDWVLTDGTPWDFNAGAAGTIQHAATVYDIDKTTGAGLISALPEGAALFDAVTMTGPLSVSASDSPLINLTPSGTGDTNVVSIVPSGALAGANTWKGLYMDGTALDPSAINAAVFGGHIDLSAVDQTNDPTLCGLLIEMPASATTSEDFHAVKLTGNGNQLVLLNKDFLIDLTSSGTVVPLSAVFSSSATNTVENAAVFKHFTTADMTALGVSICFHVEDDTSGDQRIATIWAERAGADGTGALFLGRELAGSPFALMQLGDDVDGKVIFPLADENETGWGPVRFGTAATGLDVWENGSGAILDGSGGDPRFIGDTVIVKLGDASGVEKLSIIDSADAEQAYINSNGQGFFRKLSHPTDTNTSILFNNADAIILDVGGAEGLRLDETADEIVFNGDQEDIDWEVYWDGGLAIRSDGATGNVTMPESLTVGDGVAEKILGVTDGTNTAMMGYDGVPHIVMTGDSTFIVYSDDPDSDSNFIVRGNGDGFARSRAQTSGGDWIGITHDGVRGTLDSSLGGIRMNDPVEFHSTVGYTTTGGQQFAEIYAHGVTDVVTSVAQNDWDQVVAFDTDGLSNGGLTPDHTNDHITVAVDGIYEVSFSWSGFGPNQAHDWDFHIARNNRAIDDTNAVAHLTSPATQKTVSISRPPAFIDCTAGDTIELWFLRTSAGTNVDLTTTACSINAKLIGGS